MLYCCAITSCGLASKLGLSLELEYQKVTTSTFFHEIIVRIVGLALTDLSPSKARVKMG